MPTLNWIGKDAVEKHHKEVPFRLLEPVEELSFGDTDSGNLIVQGDNLHALKALLPRYAGQVKCIYIDPPYNTGNEGWVYNDNVNSPEIRKWLGEVVGKEGETLDRHDRWLCMMYPRLVLLKQFLREDGIIFISIDDNEVAVLRLIMDDIFGINNFVAQIVWKKKTNGNNVGHIPSVHDFIVCYGFHKDSIDFPGLKFTDSYINNNFSNPDNDPRGLWTTTDLSANHKGPYFSIKNPHTGDFYTPPKGRYWVFNQNEVAKRIDEGRIIFGKKGLTAPVQRVFLNEKKQNRKPETWFDNVALNSDGMKEITDILGSKIFSHPKPSDLIKHIISFATKPNDIILDSFSGSGSTAHAVLKQNAEDNGNRRFILVEMDKDIAQNVTAERVKRVGIGYTNAKGKAFNGLGGDFQYCRLSEEPLFNSDGPIRSDVSFKQLAEFVWFMETGTGLNPSNLKLKKKKHSTPYLGQYKSRAVFLLYNGILKDKSELGGNVLNGRTLKLLEESLLNFEGPKIVYGMRSRFGKTKLVKLGITFHQLPYEFTVKTWF